MKKIKKFILGLSGKYVICALGVLLLCFTSRFPGNDVDSNEITLVAYFIYDQKQLLQIGEMASSYSVAVSFRDMEWFIVLLPVLAAFPVISDFTEEWFSGNYYMAISRTTRKKYAIKWMIKVAIESFLCVICGIFIYVLLVYIKFPSYLLYNCSFDESILANAYGYTCIERGITLICSAFHTGMLGAILAMLSVVVTVFCKNSFYAMSGLSLVEYFSKKLSSAYEGFLFYHYYEKGEEIPARYNLLRFFFPSNHLFYDQSFRKEFGIWYGVYLVILIVLSVFIVFLFYMQIRRRNE